MSQFKGKIEQDKQLADNIKEVFLYTYILLSYYNYYFNNEYNYYFNNNIIIILIMNIKLI